MLPTFWLDKVCIGQCNYDYHNGNGLGAVFWFCNYDYHNGNGLGAVLWLDKVCINQRNPCDASTRATST